MSVFFRQTDAIVLLNDPGRQDQRLDSASSKGLPLGYLELIKTKPLRSRQGAQIAFFCYGYSIAFARSLRQPDPIRLEALVLAYVLTANRIFAERALTLSSWQDGTAVRNLRCESLPTPIVVTEVEVLSCTMISLSDLPLFS